ncbi:MAG: hypothetical protein JJU06_00570 [Ectothiorhodospiraceae bacterium]|nr:hypothetical protein [Ectothiorhodospiraceae bacterium]
MVNRILIANRGEVAVRIARAAAELGITTIAVYPSDDAESLHTRIADEASRLQGRGVSAYLDMQQLIELAVRTGCDAVHPGYGFLSESEAFAALCEEHGITFVGPSASVLRRLGDKAEARLLAQECDVPVVPGTNGPTSLAQAREFYRKLDSGAALMVKAIAGGGGRGMRIVHDVHELEESFAQAQAEAQGAFGSNEVYVEQLVSRARHIEVQVIGDGSGRVAHLWERECSMQRRNQKLIEIAPSPSLTTNLRQQLAAAAVRMAQAVKYRSLGTFEFLVDTDSGRFAFIEANPRLQVEHTITEEITGIDLVQAQLRLAGGSTLETLGLTQEQIPSPNGHAMQVRINMETMSSDGSARPAGGTLRTFEPCGGPGIRVDTFGYSGYRNNPHYDSLLAKLIVHTRSTHYADTVRRAYRALCQFNVDGVETNIHFLQNLLRRPEVENNDVYTRFVDDHILELVDTESGVHPQLFFRRDSAPENETADAVVEGPPGTVPAPAPMQGILVEINTVDGEPVRAGQPIAVIEAMKMQHVVTAPISGIVRLVAVDSDTAVTEGQPLLFIEAAEVEGDEESQDEEIDLDAIRPDLAEALERHAIGLDAARPEAVAKRHQLGKRTARENIDDICDPDSFVEYGALAVAAQRSRRSIEELRRISPADGLVAGVGSVNGDLFGPERSRCALMAYDYTVFAGTQGHLGHRKTDRLMRVVESARLPVVVFAEGGGGRPGDTDNAPGVNLANPTFWHFSRISALAPLVGITSGRCFAGNAALLGCCDVVIATRDSTIGMGGPAMIEGAGLGQVDADDVGPLSVQVPNGVVDLVAEDEAEAVKLAKRYLSYFQGPLPQWSCPDQRLLRSCVPENRLRAYNVRRVISVLADEDSVLELRRGFGKGLVTALIRLEGRPCGLIANDPSQHGGAIDADEADKAARFMQLCDAFDLPIISLCDTPGFMVGPDAEKRATVRHFPRMFLIGASLSVPLFTVVLRKAYGLGAMAMSGGSFHESSQLTLSWPTGEFGAMGLEGAVTLGYRKELEAIDDPEQRQARYRELVDQLYQNGKAVNIAPFLSIDDVIDPAQTRHSLVNAIKAVPAVLSGKNSKRPMIDAW